MKMDANPFAGERAGDPAATCAQGPPTSSEQGDVRIRNAGAATWLARRPGHTVPSCPDDRINDTGRPLAWQEFAAHTAARAGSRQPLHTDDSWHKRQAARVVGATLSPALGPSARWQPRPEAFPVRRRRGIFKGWGRGARGDRLGGCLAFADENKAAGSFQIPPWEAGVMGALCFHPPRPKTPDFSQYVHSGAVCDHPVAGTADQKKGLRRELILSTRLQGARLTHFRCSRSNRTTDKLITNHAYLFIKQGLGEIQRGNTVFTAFNLQSVIKRNTAARLRNTPHVRPFPGAG